MKNKQFKNKIASNKEMKIPRLKNHWKTKKVGLKYLKTKRKLKKSKTVILMINKAGLLQIIILKKWPKLTLLT